MVCFFLIIFFIGCTVRKETKKKEDITYFNVLIPSDLHKQRELKLSAVADSVSYVILQTTPDCLISEIKGVQQNGDRLFIRSKDDQLFCFSKQGIFINKIGSKGKGPEEYYSLLDYAVDDRNVYVLDYARRVAIYGHSGDFKTYFKIPKQASRLMLLPNDKIAFYIPDNQFKAGENVYTWLLTNMQGDSVGVISTTKIRNNPEDRKFISNHFVLTNFSSQYPFSFKEAFNDSLFYIDPLHLTIKSFAVIDQGIHKIDYTKTFKQVAEAKHNMRINNLTDIPNYIFISYACMCYGNTQTHHAVYDKTKKLFYNFINQYGEEKIVNDFDPGLDFRILSCFNSGQLVGCIDAYVIAACNSNNSLFESNVKETDNPVLVFIKLKHSLISIKNTNN